MFEERWMCAVDELRNW